MTDHAPRLQRLDPATRRPLKSPPMRRCVVDLEEGGKTLVIEAATVQIQRGELRLFDSDNHMVGAVAAGAWRAWHFEPVEVELPAKHRIDPRAIT